MSGSGSPTLRAATYDGIAAADLAERLGVPAVAVFAEVGSTMDVAHTLAAAGAAAGTVAVAEAQTAGRGRQGKAWRSEPGAGIWVTVVERPRDPAAAEVLSLRVGLRLAEALDRFAPAAIRLKWPNDLYLPGGKLAGVLIEARWRDQRLDWVGIGVGLNVRLPAGERAAALRDGVSRVDVLAALVGAVRGAAAVGGQLTAGEVRAYRARDLAAGRRIVSPSAGVVAGVNASGALVVLGADGSTRAHRAGSLVFAEES